MSETTLIHRSLVVGFTLALAITMGIGGVLFGLAFRDMGAFELTPRFVLRWITNPLILGAFAAGLGSRVLYYGMLRFLNVSETTLFSALSIVATLLLARVVLDETMEPLQLLGGAFIVVGVVLVGR